jgi:hypothetical protein
MMKSLCLAAIGAATLLAQSAGDFEVALKKAKADARAIPMRAMSREGAFTFEKLGAGLYTLCTAAREGTPLAVEVGGGKAAAKSAKPMECKSGQCCADLEVDASGTLSGKVRPAAAATKPAAPARPAK